jgi:hypothetical protein
VADLGFTVNGLNELITAFEKFALLPDDTIDEMLDAEAEVFVKAHKAKIREIVPKGTGQLEKSIKAFKKKAPDPKWGLKFAAFGAITPQPYRLIYPDGIRRQYRRKAKTKTHKKTGRTYTVGGDVKDVTNAEVGFLLEFGVPRRGAKKDGTPKKSSPAYQWMRRANEECAGKALAAAAAIYDKYIAEVWDN